MHENLQGASHPNLPIHLLLNLTTVNGPKRVSGNLVPQSLEWELGRWRGCAVHRWRRGRSWPATTTTSSATVQTGMPSCGRPRAHCQLSILDQLLVSNIQAYSCGVFFYTYRWTRDQRMLKHINFPPEQTPVDTELQNCFWWRNTWNNSFMFKLWSPVNSSKLLIVN